MPPFGARIKTRANQLRDNLTDPDFLSRQIIVLLRNPEISSYRKTHSQPSSLLSKGRASRSATFDVGQSSSLMVRR
jgi:hypothetical protein